MEFKDIGDTISVAEYNALVYLLRKFKRLTTTLQIGSNDLTSDFGNYHLTNGFKNFGDNWILTEEVTLTSNDALKNCYYSFIFTVMDVNLSGEVNRRIVSIDSESTGDTGTLEVIIPSDLIAENEVILPDFNVEVIFDEHEYYTPLPNIRLSLSVDKRIIEAGEVATVTGLLTDSAGNPIKNRGVALSVNGVIIPKVTDSDGKIVYEYTGTGNTGEVLVSAMGVNVRFYDGTDGGLMIAHVSGDSFTLSSLNHPMGYTGQVNIDWGDGTFETNVNPNNRSHTYTDGESSHIIVLTGEITSLGDYCFRQHRGLNNVTIPDSVTNLGKYCFQYCDNLNSVTIPDSVTNIGNYCFYDCYGLIDYELYWTGENIIPYSPGKMQINTNTFFYIPIGTKTAYTNKGYPANKLIERGYKLTVTGDKSIIQSSETSTITAKLVNNEQPVSSESLSYIIKHDGTTIDSGTVTTDSTGTATVVYTGTGVGEVNITVEYGTLLQETYEVIDAIFVDNGTSASHNDNGWVSSGSSITMVREDEYTTLHSSVASSRSYYHLIGFNQRIELDIVSATTLDYLLVGQKTETSFSNDIAFNLSTNITGNNHLVIELTDNNLIVKVDDVVKIDRSHSISENPSFRLQINPNGSDILFKNVVIYPI